MALFKYSIDFSTLNLSDAELTALSKEPQSRKNIFESNVYFLANKKYTNGLSQPQQRTLTRILNKLDVSTDESIDLEVAEVDLLRDLFCSDIAIPADRIRMLGLYQTAIEAIILDK